MKGVKPGDKVIVVYSHNRRGNHVTEAEVTRVGHKWGYISDRERFSVDTGWLDGKGYSSPGKVYESMTSYEDDKRRGAAEAEFFKVCRNLWSIRQDATAEGIASVTAAIRDLYEREKP